jgi:hypothetical protein
MRVARGYGKVAWKELAVSVRARGRGRKEGFGLRSLIGYL